jgi:hypothetical protein
MSEEQKDTQQETAAAAGPEIVKNNNNNHLAEKRGRMVAAAVLAAVMLSVIALIVAGIFNWTAAYIMICPKDLAVNDPAPILWKELETTSAISQPLGVPKNLLSVASFKGSPGQPAAPVGKSKDDNRNSGKQ